MCQTGSRYHQSIERGGVQGEDYPGWRGFGKERVSSAWDGAQRESGMAPQAQARELAQGIAGNGGTGLRDWDGSLWRRASLGTSAAGARIHGETDRSAVCEAVCEE